MAALADAPPGAATPANKGLRAGALSARASVVLGLASTAPAYSLAAVLGFIVALPGVGVHAPAVLLVSCLPVLCVAVAYRELNRAEPDCGTTYPWVARAFGRPAGFMAGWAVLVTGVVVVGSLADVTARYAFLFVGVEEPSTVLVTTLGVVVIVLSTALGGIGIALGARAQRVLLGVELAALGLFAAVALVRALVEGPPGSVTPALLWFAPWEIGSLGALTDGVLLGVFIFWGWDALVSANEETEAPRRTPGRAAVTAVGLLFAIYAVVAVAMLAFAGPERLAADETGDVLGLLGADVFGSDALGRIVIVAVLTSALVSTQTTILPSARTVLSMAAARALPPRLAVVGTRHGTPHVATGLVGAVAALWYVGLTILSADVLEDSILALGLLIAVYYAATCAACVARLRTQGRALSWPGLVAAGGGIALVAVLVGSAVQLADPETSTAGEAWLGVGPPLVIAAGLMVVGALVAAADGLRGRR